MFVFVVKMKFCFFFCWSDLRIIVEEKKIKLKEFLLFVVNLMFE